MGDVLDHLMDEHRKVERLLADLKGSEPGSGREAAFEDLANVLDLHMLAEERHVYPLLVAHLGAEAAGGASDEHHIARQGIAQARQRLADGAFVAAIEGLEAGIGRHVEEEESDLFPKLRVRAPADLEGMDPRVLAGPVPEDAAAAAAAGLDEPADDADAAARPDASGPEPQEAVGEAP
jgi:hemerythrin-like domain-containing protein